ncbi:MAG TPA: tetratricopeptide repeat protein [Sedimentisphaerales bacterium]|nr:tetratricopeptide repeat protein [Sedimentisphaerales bacterium]
MKRTRNGTRQIAAVPFGPPDHQAGQVGLHLRMVFKSCSVLLCLTFVPLHLLISLAGTTYANTATDIPAILPQNNPTVPRDSNSLLRHQLVREQIRVVEGKADRENESALRQMIEQVRSVRFGPEEKQTAAPAVASAKTPVIDPNGHSFDGPAKPENQKQDTESKRSAEKVTDQTLQKLKTLAGQPDKVGDPLELGEILFSGGSLEEAVTFYREALKRIDPNDPTTPGDRPWILFQIGNCLRDHDRPAAAKIYGQLLTEYPQSPWTELGKAEGKLVEWYLRDTPRKLIEEPEQIGRK